MNHEDALHEMSAERYLLGELTGRSRELFEEHLFECQLCALDVKSGATLFEGVRAQLAAPEGRTPVQAQKLGPFHWLFHPAWMVPAFAACLLFLVYQSFVVIPGMRRQIAKVEAPAVVKSLVLAGGGARGGKPLSVAAREHGSFLLSVDIPTSAAYSSYRCVLSSPSGASVWQGEVTPEQAKDTVMILIPADVTQPGENTLLIQGLRQGDAPGAKLDDLITHSFLLALRK